MKIRRTIFLVLGILCSGAPLSAQTDPPPLSPQTVDIELLRAVLDHDLQRYPADTSPGAMIIERRVAGVGRDELAASGAPIWRSNMIGQLADDLGIRVGEMDSALRCPENPDRRPSHRCTFSEGTDVVIAVGLPSLEGDTAEVMIDGAIHSVAGPPEHRGVYSFLRVYRAVREGGLWKVVDIPVMRVH